jgi:hypothetical protein
VPAVDMPGQNEEVDPEKQAEAEQAAEYAEFAQEVVKDGNMDTLLVDVAKELLDGQWCGSKVAEIVLKPFQHEGQLRLGVKAIRCKHRSATGYVVDEYGNLLGLVTHQPGRVDTNRWLTNEELNNPDVVIPREKFVIYQHAMKDGDPRGNSILRPAYLPWFLKTKVLPEYFRYLKQFATPSLIGTTPEGTPYVQTTDSEGNLVYNGDGSATMVSAQQELLRALLSFLNASAIALPFGSKVDLVQSEGDGAAFLNACDYCDRQIAMAILGTARATMEAEHGSKADGTIAQDVVGLRVSNDKLRLGAILTRDLMRLLILVNFGEEALRLCPMVALSKAEQQDRVKLIEAYSKAFASGLLHESQLPGADVECGFPPRDMEAIAREKAEKAEMERLIAGHQGTLLDPVGDVKPPKEDTEEEQREAGRIRREAA